MFCLKCGKSISLLGLLDRETKYEQYICSECNAIHLKNTNGLVFLKDELLRLPEYKTSEEV